MTFLAYIFPKLQTAQDLLGPMSKEIRFKKRSDSHHVERSQTLFEFERQHFIIYFHHSDKNRLRKIFS